MNINGQNIKTYRCNVQLMFNLFSSLHRNKLSIILYMILHSKNNIYHGTIKALSTEIGCSIKTASRSLNLLLIDNVIERVGKSKWKINIPYIHDEEYEKISNAEQNSCFAFYFFKNDNVEEIYDDNSEDFESYFYRLKREWDTIKKDGE